MSTGTLLFSGTDLATLCTIEDLSDFWSSADLRGDLPVYAGVPGATPGRRPQDGRVVSGQVTTFTGSSLADTEDAIAAIKAVLRINQPQVLTRRKITNAGNLDTTQNVIVRTAAERLATPLACTLLLGVELLDGVWYGASRSIASITGSGTVTVAGEVSTAAITATLAAGAVNPVVTNTSNGYTFRYVGTVPTGGVTVDVRARKATKVSDSSDVSSALKWSKEDPFLLDPGSQTITISTGSVSFTYLPAYA